MDESWSEPPVKKVMGRKDEARLSNQVIWGILPGEGDALDLLGAKTWTSQVITWLYSQRCNIGVQTKNDIIILKRYRVLWTG